MGPSWGPLEPLGTILPWWSRGFRVGLNFIPIYSEIYICDSFQIEQITIAVTVFHLILNQMDVRLVHIQKKNGHYDHIPFNFQRITNLFPWVHDAESRQPLERLHALTAAEGHTWFLGAVIRPVPVATTKGRIRYTLILIYICVYIYKYICIYLYMILFWFSTLLA